MLISVSEHFLAWAWCAAGMWTIQEIVYVWGYRYQAKSCPPSSPKGLGAWRCTDKVIPISILQPPATRAKRGNLLERSTQKPRSRLRSRAVDLEVKRSTWKSSGFTSKGMAVRAEPGELTPWSTAWRGCWRSTTRTWRGVAAQGLSPGLAHFRHIRGLPAFPMLHAKKSPPWGPA